MTQAEFTGAVATARDYYNSTDADNFYHTIWGGEDIHIGVYAAVDEAIVPASRRSVEHLAKRIEGLDASKTVLDIGAGFGGAARYLAKTFGCRVVALNLSEVENERDREKNREQGLTDLIEVVDGSFEAVPKPDASFNVVWSQDAILHSGDREQVLREVVRVLKPGGQFVFSDPMRADDCPEGVLQPILDRIHLSDLGSPGFYRKTAAKLGLEEVGFEPMTEHLVTHYSRVLEATEARRDELKGVVSDDYVERMKKGLGHWVEGGRKGYLAWGIFSFRKPA